MKLIIAGASGFVASEILRQSLRHPEITSVVALARKPVSAPAGTDAAKLRSVVIEDYATYPDDVKKEFANANACIWTVAITPSKSKLYNFEDVRRICHTSTIAGFKAMYEAGPAKPFRFLYMSGIGTVRDPNVKPKVPSWMMDYCLMRGATENDVIAFAAEHKGEVEACVAKPGLITSNVSIVRSIWGTALKWTNPLHHMPLEELSAAVLDQVLHGFKNEPLTNEDLTTIGQKLLKVESKP